MTCGETSPGLVLQEVAPAPCEVVMWSIGELRKSRKRCKAAELSEELQFFSTVS